MSLVKLQRHWESFFFKQADFPTADILRIGYSSLMLINVLILGLDLKMFFSEEGLLTFSAAQALKSPLEWTLFSILPKNQTALLIAYGLLVTHLFFLLIGWSCKMNAFWVFIWMVSFQHRNPLLFDGEDTVFRLLGFLLIFMPIGHYFVLGQREKSSPKGTIWAIRLLQIQISVIYLSTAMLKIRGDDWQSGHALHYVSRLDDLFGRFPTPQFLFDVSGLGIIMTWSVVLFETLLPFALWSRTLRPIAIVLGILFHLSIDYTMNLFLFQWLMILGLSSFIGKEEIAFFKSKLRFLKGSNSVA